MSGTAAPILIFTTHTGGGHMNLARSLQGLLERDHEVVIIDPQSALVERFYTTVSRYSLSFLNWQYIVTDNACASLSLHRFLTLLSRGRLRHIIERVRPRLIITTHAFLSYEVARAREGLRIPLVFQLTDLGQVHTTWFSEKRADAYLAPTREIFEQALQQGIERKRLHLTGRPVRSQFMQSGPDMRSETLTALGLDPEKFTVFLQGGAKGSAGVARTLESLLSIEEPVQVILAVGNNRQMAQRYANSARVRCLPFTETIAPYMAAADVIAGKAGASFISEAFMVERPFLVTDYIPGQETPNLRFIEEHNLGWICLEPEAQRELLAKLARDPQLCTEKRAAARAYRAWNMQANERIGPLIRELLAAQASN